jgi:hypothetical protein
VERAASPPVRRILSAEPSGDPYGRRPPDCKTEDWIINHRAVAGTSRRRFHAAILSCLYLGRLRCRTRDPSRREAPTRRRLSRPPATGQVRARRRRRLAPAASLVEQTKDCRSGCQICYRGNLSAPGRSHDQPSSLRERVEGGRGLPDVTLQLRSCVFSVRNLVAASRRCNPACSN